MMRIVASSLATACLVLGLGGTSGLKVRNPKPRGAGIPEHSKELACAECAKHAPYLDGQQDCSCHATDIMGTFENDATKTLTTAKEFDFETVNTGAERLKEGWLWHC